MLEKTATLLAWVCIALGLASWSCAVFENDGTLGIFGFLFLVIGFFYTKVAEIEQKEREKQ